MAEFMDGEATAEDGIAVLAAAITNYIPQDGSSFMKNDDGSYRTKTNPVEWMLDLAIAIIAIERACGIDKRDTRKMLAEVRARIDMDMGQDLLHQAIGIAQVEILSKVRPAIEEAKQQEADAAGETLPPPEVSGN